MSSIPQCGKPYGDITNTKCVAEGSDIHTLCRMHHTYILIFLKEKRLFLEDGLTSQLLNLLIFFEEKSFQVTSEDHVYVTVAKLNQMETLKMKGQVSYVKYAASKTKH